MRDTAPAEPNEATWQRVRDRIEAARPAPQRRSRRPWVSVAVIAASIIVVRRRSIRRLEIAARRPMGSW